MIMNLSMQATFFTQKKYMIHTHYPHLAKLSEAGRVELISFLKTWDGDDKNACNKENISVR